jgi:hypothetical protein
MPLPSSGSISASEIKNEFGTNNSPQIRIGQYRDATTHGGKQWPFDVDIPIGTGSNDTTTTIKFSDFRGKQLNTITVIDGSDENRVTAAKEDKEVVGGLKSSTSKSVRAKARNIIYVVNKTIGSEKGSRNKCALRTGTSSDWYGTSEQKSPKINIELGEGAKLYGAGGNGGRGGDDSGGTSEVSGNPGQSGTSALGIEVATESIVVNSGANIIAGGGGGGGGGGAKNDEFRRAGSGGGGGSGIPAGNGGDDGEGKGGFNGGNGSATESGNGGDGDIKASNGGGVAGGGGGGGGFDGEGGEAQTKSGSDNQDDSQATDGGDGTSGSSGQGGNGGDGNAEGGNQKEGVGGAGGTNGYAITSSGNLAINVTVGSSRVKGTQQQNGGVS